MSRPPRLLSLAACGLLLWAPACAKRAAESAPPTGSMDYGGSGGGDMAVAEAAPATAPAEPAPDYKKMDDAEYERVDIPKDIHAAPAKAGGAAAPTDGRLEPPKQKPSEAGPGDEKDDSKPKQVGRQIVYTAEMGISVYKLDEAMERAEALALEAGGYVQSMSQGYYVLRVPAAQLRKVMAELGKLGVVESRSLQAQDVTEEYVDLTTRIRVLRETQQQLLALLKSARNVEEALNVRRSLDQITMELEQAMGRLRMLESLIGFSTLTVRMTQRGPQNTIPSSNDPFPWVDGLGVEATEWN